MTYLKGIIILTHSKAILGCNVDPHILIIRCKNIRRRRRKSPYISLAALSSGRILNISSRLPPNNLREKVQKRF